VSDGKLPQVAGVVCCHDATPESDRGSDDQGIDRHLAPNPGACEQVASDPCHAGSSGHHLSETSRQDTVDRFVDTSAAVQLHEHRRRDPNRRVARVRAAHDGSHPLVANLIDMWASESRNGLAVKD